MEDLRGLTQTEQLVQSANIIKEKSLSLLQSRNMGEEFIDKQIEINKCVDEYVAGLGNIDNVSTEKLFDFSDVFKTPGAIKPDIEVPLTAKDIENKTDKTLTVAIDYINKNFDIEKEKN